jgi:hypothetical protein
MTQRHEQYLTQGDFLKKHEIGPDRRVLRGGKEKKKKPQAASESG